MQNRFRQQTNDSMQFPSCFGRFAKAATLASFLTLAGCGGGGGGGDGGSANEAATAPPATSTVFVAPAGPLCAQRDTLSGACIQPTSSSTTPAALRAALLDPQGEVYQFELFGSEFFSTWDSVDGNFIGSSQNYSLSIKNVMVGKNQFIADGRTYANKSPAVIPGFEQFVADAEHAFHLGGDGGYGMFPLLAVDGVASISRPPPYLTMSLYGTHWGGTMGLLTDKYDAPIENEISYTGRVLILSGDGSPSYPSTTEYRAIGGSCPITLKFNPSSGELDAASVACNSPEPDQSTITFELPGLRFKNSRASAAADDKQAAATIEGYCSNYPESIISARFQTTRIEGGIYGPGAKYITLFGAGPLGYFQIVAFR